MGKWRVVGDGWRAVREGEGVGRVICVPDGVAGRSEIVQEQRPFSITAKHTILFTVCLLLFNGY
jgi:hypothetical protein